MSVDQAFREMIRAEIARELRPLQNLVNQLQQSTNELDGLRALAQGLGPIAAMFGLSTTAAPAPRRGRPPKNAVRARTSEVAAGERGCGVEGCPRASRTKGYCAAHYQKLRLLIRTHRRPADWIDFPAPATVKEVVLPRGRAAVKARKGA